MQRFLPALSVLALTLACDPPSDERNNTDSSSPETEHPTESTPPTCDGTMTPVAVQSSGGYIDSEFALLAAPYGYEFLHISEHCVASRSGSNPAFAGSLQLSNDTVASLTQSMAALDRVEYHAQDFGNRNCDDAPTLRYHVGTRWFDCYCGCDVEQAPKALLPFIEAANHLLDSTKTSTLIPTTSMGVAVREASSVSSQRNGCVQPVDSFSPAVLTLARLASHSLHRIHDPSLVDEIHRLQSEYTQYCESEQLRVEFERVLDLEDRNGLRLQIVSGELFTPSFDAFLIR